MMRNYLFLVLLCLVALIFVAIVKIYLFAASSPVGLTLENTIDISGLRITDYNFLSKGEKNEIFLIRDGYEKRLFSNQSPITSIGLSSSQKQAAFFYLLTPKTSTDNIALTIFNLRNNMFKEVYRTSHASWDIRSDLHWLGDNYVFFLRYCGTACQGITLLDLNTGKTKNAVLSYPSFPNQPVKTHFKDWYGQEFVMNGLVSNISSEQAYLIFQLENPDELSHEQRFLFTKTQLRAL